MSEDVIGENFNANASNEDLVYVNDLSALAPLPSRTKKWYPFPLQERFPGRYSRRTVHI